MAVWRIHVQCIVLLFFMAKALAASNLYQTQVRVPAGAVIDRQTVVNDAFRQVIVKVAGTRAILESKAIQAYTSKANEMVATWQVLGPEASVDHIRAVAVSFNPARIQEVLLAVDQDVWISKRAAIMLWLVDSDTQSEQIYNADNQPYIDSLISQIDMDRGITVILPLLDLEDMSKISAQDIRDVNLEAVNTASKRYGAPLELLGQVHTSQEGITIDWILVQDFSRQSFSTSGSRMAMALRAGLDEGIDRIAKRYAQRASRQKEQASPVMLTVYSVKDVDHYTNLLDYLRRLSVIEQVDVKRIGHDDVTLQMLVMGGRSALVNVFMDDRKLAPLEEGGALDPQNLRYQLIA